MVIFLRIVIAIFALQATYPLFAADKPLWSMNIKPQGTQKDPFSYLQGLNNTDAVLSVRFLNKNEILISFLRYEFADKKKAEVEESKTTLVELLLDRETGKLKEFVERPMEESITPGAFRIYTFPEGYLKVTDDTLQAFDLSWNVIREKTLEPLPEKHKYNVITPNSGFFFIVERWGLERNYEVIDWRTFETIEKRIISGFSVVDIWNDRLLAFSVSESLYTGLLEKKIGDLAWNRIPGSDLPKLENAGYVFNGAVIVQCNLYFTPSFWFVIERDGRRSPAVSYGINSQERIGNAMRFTGQRPVVAFSAYNLPSFRDWGIIKPKWLDVWDVPTGQRLLRTRSEKDTVEVTLSQDGRSLVRITEKKLEMYVVPDTPVKKK